MIHLAIVGTGKMGSNHARFFNDQEDCRILAGCDVDKSRVEDFCKEHEIPDTYTDLGTLLKRDDIDAIVNVTPDPFHASISIAALEAGKHVFCEKPLATNYRDALEMARVAEKSGKINMVNFSYRNHSAIQTAHEMIKKGELGRIMHVEASYLQSWLNNNSWGDWKTTDRWLWRLSTGHGSMGALGDLGVHIIDFTSYAAGDLKSVHCRLKTFHKAENDRVGEYHLDANDSAIITVEFTGGGIGTIHTSRWASPFTNRLALQIHGECGAIRIDLDKSKTALELSRTRDGKAESWKVIESDPTPTNGWRFLDSIKTGINDQPDFARGAAIQKALDACLESDRNDKTVVL